MNQDGLKQPITSLKGIGEKTAKLYNKCGIERVEDLLLYYPRTYDILPQITPVSEARAGEMGAFCMLIKGGIAARYIRRLSILSMTGADQTGDLQITYFNMPYLRKTIKPRTFYVFKGTPIQKGNRLILQQPQMFSPEDYARISGTLQPRYPLVKGLTNNGISKAVRLALEDLPYMEDILPEALIEENKLCSKREAIAQIHFPRDVAGYENARRRLAYDEFLLFILALRFLKREEAGQVNAHPMIETANTVRLIERLPYRLTVAQNKVWEEIRNDLSGTGTMNRLIQGDVGSGKTILAFLALLLTCTNGYQGAMMAPTEVLARQHFESMQEMIKAYGLPLRPVLLIGALSAKEKREARAGIADGTYNVVLGTNALMQASVDFQNLALAITDEQHRFGVQQRQKLSGKGENVHVLAMSATPIPRTLAMILYGDLHISVIDSLPEGRLPIKNCVVNTSYRKTAYKFIAEQIARGRQAYVICPMIEEGEMEGMENVTDYATKLSAALPETIRIGVLHGRMKPALKDQIMEDYAAGCIDVLVSTTVIEVGINVPNATVMMIENAEHFGLAQLHQLRGRVGRGSEQSYCIFMNTSDKEEGAKRLEIMNSSNDGFAIAEEDLKQRGPGDLFGLRQSGELQFQIGDIYRDADLIQKAAADADALLSEDPELSLKTHIRLQAAVEKVVAGGLVL